MDMNKQGPPPPIGFQTVAPPPPYQPNPPLPPQPSVVVVGAPAFGTETQRMMCPHCHNNISTSVETEANSKTHMFALILCILGLWCCVPCPYCMDSCMTTKHYCPSCKAYLGQSDN